MYPRTSNQALTASVLTRCMRAESPSSFSRRAPMLSNCKIHDLKSTFKSRMDLNSRHVRLVIDGDSAIMHRRFGSQKIFLPLDFGEGESSVIAWNIRRMSRPSWTDLDMRRTHPWPAWLSTLTDLTDYKCYRRTHEASCHLRLIGGDHSHRLSVHAIVLNC